MALPLILLTKKGQPFVSWGKDQQNSFDQLKTLLYTPICQHIYTASVSTQPTLTETMHNDYSNLATIDDNYSTSQTHSANGYGMLTNQQLLPEPENSDDECEYAPISYKECSSSEECGDETDVFLWPENDFDEYLSDIKQSLIQWVVDCNIPRCHVTNLRKRLHSDAKLTFLPLDSRTLISSKRGKIEVREMRTGKYQHCDIVASLLKILAAMELSGVDIPEVLYMLVNVDGIPLSKSSSIDFWAILIKILGEPIDEKTFSLVAYTTEAKTVGRVTYPQLNAPLHTNYSFRKRLQVKHHDNDDRRSLIENNLVDCVQDVVLDYMHLVCIGVRKKDLTEWVSGTFDRLRFSKETIANICNNLIGIEEYITKVFARKLRPLPELPRWKATELRLDLLYICPDAYKTYMSTERYSHMMLLHVAIKLLVNRETCKTYMDYADSLLRLYVSTGARLYGAKYVTFNVHNLIHLANDVRKHGPLDDFSVFPLENKLQKMKKVLRKSGKPLQQIVRRLDEINKANSNQQPAANSRSMKTRGPSTAIKDGNFATATASSLAGWRRM
uniref:Uncharacterized protein n=1 Tax=Daphnia galeata TaxID=27404 RepID=A0A8J2WC03_9CRUS|nr:unnamed protein product [Daphnia galeata]